MTAISTTSTEPYTATTGHGSYASVVEHASTPFRAPSYLIPEHVYICETTDGIVFLDAKRNKYFAIDQQAAEAVRSDILGLFTSRGVAEDPQDLNTFDVHESLEAAGLLTRKSEDGRAFTSARLPVIDIERSVSMLDRCPQLKISHIINFIYSWLKACALIRFRSLQYIISTIEEASAHSAPSPSSVQCNIAETLFPIFHRLRSLICPVSDRCLVISLALYLFMGRYNLRPFFIIGVSTNPFHAHSWLQFADIALDARPDRLDPLTVLFAQ